MEPVNMAVRLPVNTAAQMPYPNGVCAWLLESRKSLEKYMRSREEAETRLRQEAQAERSKRLAPKPLPQYSQPRPQPEKLCSCPLHCDKKISKEQKKAIYEQFRDRFGHIQQNMYIQRHMKIKGQGLEDKAKRTTCKYVIPTIGSAKESNRHARTLNYDTVTRFLDSSVAHRNGFRLNADTGSGSNDSPIDQSNSELITSAASTSVPKMNGLRDLSPQDQQQLDPQAEDMSNGDVAKSPASSNDDDDAGSVKSADGETDNVWDFSDDDDSAIDYSSRVRYVEVCQKAFMNMYGITEKRIRWQREKLSQKLEFKSQMLAEERLEEAKERRKEAEEKNRVLSVARSLGAGCKPLFDLLTRTNSVHTYFPHLIVAIGDDVDKVNDFFQNQLWKLEDMIDTSVDLASLFSIEMESD